MMNIGNIKQLFVDDELIESMVNVFQVLNPGRKHSANPLIRADKPWEETKSLLVYGTSVYDPSAPNDQRFRLWYQAILSKDYGSANHPGPLLATSSDGIHWNKPILGVANLNGSDQNNAIWANNSRGWVSSDGLAFDPDDPDASRRYKLLGFIGADEPEIQRPGYGAFFSPDGIHWIAHESNPLFAYDHKSVCEVATTIYNEQSATPRKDHPLDVHRYYGSVKYSSFMCDPIWDASFGQMRRAAGILTSDDFIHWSPNYLVLQPDSTDDFLARQRVMSASASMLRSRPHQQRAEFYGMGLMPYGDILLGFLWVFDSSGSVREDGGNQDGPLHVQLTGTRDLRHWKRLGERMPVLSPGADGEWDSGCVYTCNRPIVVGDEIWLYYSGSNHGHFGKVDSVSSIGLAIWRLDGFVSINANQEVGSLVTKPFVFSGNRLFLNATTEGGSITVEMQDETGTSIEGFTSADCIPVEGDSLRHEVAWKSGRNPGDLHGRAVKLTFKIRRAKLYSFQFDQAVASPLTPTG